MFTAVVITLPFMFFLQFQNACGRSSTPMHPSLTATRLFPSTVAKWVHESFQFFIREPLAVAAPQPSRWCEHGAKYEQNERHRKTRGEVRQPRFVRIIGQVEDWYAGFEAAARSPQHTERSLRLNPIRTPRHGEFQRVDVRVIDCHDG